jgi:hypothetical protein
LPTDVSRKWGELVLRISSLSQGIRFGLMIPAGNSKDWTTKSLAFILRKEIMISHEKICFGH